MTDTQASSNKEKIIQELAVLQSKFSREELQMLGSMLLLDEPEESEVAGHMMGSMLTYDVAMQHHKDLLRQAEESRIANRLAKGSTPFWPRLIWGFGNFLATTGRRMMTRPMVVRTTHNAGD